MSPTTIQLLLLDGTPDGPKIVKTGNWNGVALVAPRATWPTIKSRPQFDGPGVYVLVGPPEATPDGAIYIGEADILRPRIDQHYAQKDFWVRFIAFASDDGSLNKAKARYLESRLISLAASAKRSKLENGNNPAVSTLNEFERADADNFLREMLVIYPIVGLNSFELPTSGLDDSSLLYLKAPSKVASATGIDASEGFVVKAGAIVEATEAAACPPHVRQLRTTLIESGVLVAEGSHLVLTQDYVFPSPSSAAAAVLARNANGRTEWRDGSGRTLKQLQEAATGA